MRFVVIGLIICLTGISAYGETYPSNAGVLNVQDYGAKGDGTSDDTAAINKAIAASTPSANTGDYWGQAKIIYFPSGTYIISSPLIKNNGAGSATYGMVLIGQSQSTTTIKLTPGAAGFQDPSHPQGMIYPTSDAAAGWAPLPGDGNAAYQNTIQDLTIDTGTGNAGAIGIDYLASNLGAIRNVTVQAPSGTTGVTGIRMTRQDMGPALLENVTVNGFQVGLDVANLQYSLTVEHLTLNGQTVAGLRNAQNQIAVNGLTATTAGPAIVNRNADGEVVLAAATLHQAGGYTGGLIVNQGTIVFRNSNTVDGYQTFAGSSLPNDIVNGMLTPGGFINGASGSYNTQTAILDPPAAIADPVSSWASVATYDALTSADFTDINDNVPTVVDATAGIQAAMNSGSSTIYFPHGVYYISTPITIPSTVQRIVGMDSTLHPTPYENWRTEGMFRILSDAATPLTIEQLRFDNSNDGNQLALEQASNRTVVARDVLFPGTLAVNRASSGGPLFMEDVSAAGSNVTLAGSATFEARQFDFENCGTCAYLSGVPSVLIGFKEEGNVTEVAATNGAHVDVLGGLAYMVWNATTPTTPLFSADETSTLAASFDEAVIGSCCTIANYLDQRIGGQDYDTSASAFLSRSDGGHVVGMLRTGPSIFNPSSTSVAVGETVAFGGLTVTDAVAESSGSSITLKASAGSGTVVMKDGSGNQISGSGTGTIQYSGSLSAVNAALATLSYTAGSAPETDTLLFQITDQMGAGIMGNSYVLVGGGGGSGSPLMNLSAASLIFGNQNSGSTSAPQTVTLTNAGTASLTLSGITISGSGASSFGQTNTCGAALAAEASCTISVTLAPAGAGSFQATLSITDNAAQSPKTVALSGTGVAAPAPDFTIAASPSSVIIASGQSATVTLTVTPQNSFDKPVSFACSDESTALLCSFAPSSVTPTGGAAQSMLTVTAGSVPAVAKSSLVQQALACVVLSLFYLSWRPRNALSKWMVLLAPLALVPLLTCCRSGSNIPANPMPITYTVTLAATSGSLQHTSQLTVTLQ